MSEVYGQSTLPLVQHENNLSLYALQSNLLRIWTQKKVDKYYQTAMLAYMDNLPEQQAKKEIIRQHERMLENKSQYNIIKQYINHREEVLDLLQQTLEDQNQIQDACQGLDELRKINLKLCQCIFAMKQSLENRGLNANAICQGYNELFKNLNNDNANIVNSYLRKYISFGKGLDPFFLVPYQRIQKNGINEQTPKCVTKLFKMNISYVYRLIKSKNQIIKCLSCACLTDQDSNNNEEKYRLKPRRAKQHIQEQQEEESDKIQSKNETLEKQKQKQRQRQKKNKSKLRKPNGVASQSQANKSSPTKIFRQKQAEDRRRKTQANQIKQKIKLPKISDRRYSNERATSGLTIKRKIGYDEAHPPLLAKSPIQRQKPKLTQESDDEIDSYRRKIIAKRTKLKSYKNPINILEGQKTQQEQKLKLKQQSKERPLVFQRKLSGKKYSLPSKQIQPIKKGQKQKTTAIVQPIQKQRSKGLQEEKLQKLNYKNSQRQLLDLPQKQKFIKNSLQVRSKKQDNKNNINQEEVENQRHNSNKNESSEESVSSIQEQRKYPPNRNKTIDYQSVYTEDPNQERYKQKQRKKKLMGKYRQPQKYLEKQPKRPQYEGYLKKQPSKQKKSSKQSYPQTRRVQLPKTKPQYQETDTQVWQNDNYKDPEIYSQSGYNSQRISNRGNSKNQNSHMSPNLPPHQSRLHAFNGSHPDCEICLKTALVQGKMQSNNNKPFMKNYNQNDIYNPNYGSPKYMNHYTNRPSQNNGQSYNNYPYSPRNEMYYPQTNNLYRNPQAGRTINQYPQLRSNYNPNNKNDRNQVGSSLNGSPYNKNYVNGFVEDPNQNNGNYQYPRNQDTNGNKNPIFYSNRNVNDNNSNFHQNQNLDRPNNSYTNLNPHHASVNLNNLNSGANPASNANTLYNKINNSNNINPNTSSNNYNNSINTDSNNKDSNPNNNNTSNNSNLYNNIHSNNPNSSYKGSNNMNTKNIPENHNLNDYDGKNNLFNYQNLNSTQGRDQNINNDFNGFSHNYKDKSNNIDGQYKGNNNLNSPNLRNNITTSPNNNGNLKSNNAIYPYQKDNFNSIQKSPNTYQTNPNLNDIKFVDNIPFTNNNSHPNQINRSPNTYPNTPTQYNSNNTPTRSPGTGAVSLQPNRTEDLNSNPYINSNSYRNPDQSQDMNLKTNGNAEPNKNKIININQTSPIPANDKPTTTSNTKITISNPTAPTINPNNNPYQNQGQNQNANRNLRNNQNLQRDINNDSSTKNTNNVKNPTANLNISNPTMSKNHIPSPSPNNNTNTNANNINTNNPNFNNINPNLNNQPNNKETSNPKTSPDGNNKVNSQRSMINSSSVSNSNDPNKAPTNSSQNQMKSSTSSPIKRQIQLKPQQIDVQDLFNFIQTQKISNINRTQFQVGTWKQNIRNKHVYMTKFLCNSQIAAFGLCTPQIDGDYRILYWGVIADIPNTYLFKKYLEYLQKFTSLNKIFINSSSYGEMQFVKQGVDYIRKRSIFNKKQLGYEPFLSLQCSNIQFNQKSQITHSTFYSQQIQDFKQSFTHTSLCIGLAQPQKTKQELPKSMKFYNNLQNIGKVNKILEQLQADTYAANQQIATGQCKLIVFKERLNIKKSQFYVREGYFMTKGCMIYQTSINNEKGSYKNIVYRLELEEGIFVFFGKKFQNIRQFINACNFKAGGPQRNFAFKMFTKQLYGRLKNGQYVGKGCYGNWDIDFIWQDQLKGTVIKPMPQSNSVFGPQNFYVAIFKLELLLYGFQVNSNDFLL